MTQTEHDPVFDTVDEAETKKRQAAARIAVKTKRDADDRVFAWVMKGPTGRAFVWRLLNRAGIFQTSYVPNAAAMAHAEGMKEQAYWLLAQIRRVCPETEVTMIQEQSNGRAGTGNS